jgi:hypothetical protein
LNFEARMRRAGTCTACANHLAIRGVPSPLSTNGWWNKEYLFEYTNNGYFSVWKINNNTETAVKDWTTTYAIDPGGWNVLRVTAQGTQLKFYINDQFVWSGTDSSFTNGQVGIGMYRAWYTTGNKLLVDWATLQPTLPHDTLSADEVLDVGEEVSGGDIYQSP